MALGRVVDTSVRLLIARVYQEHPDWRAKEVKAEVNKRLGKDWPGLSVVQKELSKIRERLEVDDPQDKPWSTATLNDYPIPPEALRAVLMVWKSRVEKGTGFTIREAKWVSRLSTVLREVPISKELRLLAGPPGEAEVSPECDGRTAQSEMNAFPHVLWEMARWYARTELMYELIDRPFDSTGLDKLLMGLERTWDESTPSFLAPLLVLDLEVPDGQEQTYPFIAHAMRKSELARELTQEFKRRRGKRPKKKGGGQ